MSENIDKIREEFTEDRFEIIDSIGLVAVLSANFIYPCALRRNGNYTSCIYKVEDDLFQEIVLKWDEGFYDEFKVINKQFSKIKKSFATLNIDDMKAYR
ncbi:hypothetical protein [Clostridium sp. FP1]|uniref:hypothetical protein n=1 Tax=Clostridium sp. FP1 TaxID=2724076 RepID=UPI0013E98C85|nr:hypothetical protein [Clostridium sp. FP1]MBZ9635516.1 hypothetical protein [Clostridium sp. FP1]